MTDAWTQLEHGGAAALADLLAWVWPAETQEQAEPTGCTSQLPMARGGLMRGEEDGALVGSHPAQNEDPRVHQLRMENHRLREEWALDSRAKRDEIKRLEGVVQPLLNQNRNRAPLIETFHWIADEVERARRKFPGTAHLTVALGEEFGELCQAQLKGLPRIDIVKEAIQVAAVAIRIIEEGDVDFVGDTKEQQEGISPTECEAPREKSAYTHLST